MTMPNKIRIVMLTREALNTPGPLSRVLDALEGSGGLEPTHWGRDDRARDPYSHERLLDAVKQPDEPLVLGLRRTKSPRYEAHVSIGDPQVRMFSLEVQSGVSAANLRRAFDLGDALASATRPEFGLVHLVWSDAEGGDGYNATGVLSAKKFQSCGPDAVAARTWMGSHMSTLIGRRRLEGTGVPLHECDGGIVRFDLLPEPWEADFAALSTRQREVMQQLGDSGVFGDYSSWRNCSGGHGWRPVP